MNTNTQKYQIVGYRRGSGGLNSQAGMRGRKPREQNELYNSPDALDDIPEQNELKIIDDMHKKTIKEKEERMRTMPIDDKNVKKENVDTIQLKEDANKTEPPNSS